ncbi:hypothetical protein [Halosolutus gelatinilyticus]|uniref:hypothetical protein n=1 Tax=Halosolutus gelatinilyticus TaxID=2931975 RepID=UPI001FF5DAE8|nr:hypothetical protein [Halosolutus gelatinilyticus]
MEQLELDDIHYPSYARVRAIRRLLRKGAVGSPVPGSFLEDSLREHLVADPDVPIEAHGGGHRANIRLISSDAAVDYLKSNGGDVPFGFD